MKKVILLLFILSSFNILALSSNNLSNSTKSSEQKEKNLELEEIEKLKQQIEEMNIKLSIMEKESNKIGLTYNIDQIYSTAKSFYNETLTESKEYYKKSFDDVKLYYENAFNTLKDIAFAIIGLGLTAILGIGIFQILDYSKISDKIDKKTHFITKELYQNFNILKKELLKKVNKIDKKTTSKIELLYENIDKKIAKLREEILSNTLQKSIKTDNKSWMRISDRQIIQVIELKMDISKKYSRDIELLFPVAFSKDWINYSIIGDHDLKVIDINQLSARIEGEIKSDCKLIFTGY